MYIYSGRHHEEPVERNEEFPRVLIPPELGVHAHATRQHTREDARPWYADLSTSREDSIPDLHLEAQGD